MSAIQSSTGLITGINIDDTVTKLIQVASQPRAQLSNRNDGLKSQQAAVDTLSSLVLGLKFSLGALGRDATYASRTAASSDTSAVAVSVARGANPAVGTYRFTPLRNAATHQLTSDAVLDKSASLGSGTLSLRVGGQVDRSTRLADLNGGVGVPAGLIKITDGAGDSANIDLRGATTIDDVLRAINQADGVSVSAAVDGDHLVLTDNSGGSGAFSVAEVSGGKTAAGLGLAGISASASTLTGQAVNKLAATSRLGSLNDGVGVGVDNKTSLDDLEFTLADGTTAGVDLTGAQTLGDVLQRINGDAQLQGKATAAIGPDGRRIVVTDLTTGGGSLSIANGLRSTAADDLGLSGASAGGVVTGRRLVAGLADTLVAGLNGGKGVANGSIQITDRSGASATVDLSGAETLDEVIQRINDAGIGVRARVNDARSGLRIDDTTGGTGSLVIADSGGTAAADLGVAVNAAVSSVDSGSLDRRTVGRATRLADLNGGDGVPRGRIRITDSDGLSSTIDLQFLGQDQPTLGDVIDKINGAAAGVEATINETGDGILLTDTANGSGTLRVTAVDGGDAASALHIAGSSTATDGQGRQTIDGTSKFSIDLSSLGAGGAQSALESLRGGLGIDTGVVQITDSSGATAYVNLAGAATLQDVLDRINDSSVQVTATLNEAGTALVLTDDAGGTGKLSVDDVGSGTAAADLGVKGDSTRTDSQGRQTVQGGSVVTTGGPLDLLAQRINNLDAGFTASVVFDGAAYRLSIGSSNAGVDNELLIDSGATTLAFSETSRPSDAVALFGSSGSTGFTVTSSDGKFNSVVAGLNITSLQATGQPVTITVATNDDPLTKAINDFVKSYNDIRTNLGKVASFDATNNTTGILFGRSEVLRVDADLSRIASGRFLTGGQYTTLESIGVSVNRDGTLSVDQGKLADALTNGRDSVQRLFTDSDSGVVKQFSDATDRLAGDENSALSARSITLQDTIDTNQQRLDDWDVRLNKQRDRLFTSFYNLENVVAALQNNLQYLDSITFISGK